ncbi:uncharacterized protein LOC131285904 [Anopheles ziemanni]|uniref:uncharacterized protein LOC131269837 n=1 Tax=Anopheles coustani TaxID=139045 RepID=UPI00265981F3|nr:uncharacterized protein LOC131269837 [Anopheles coustani]XP_058170741.1 uncharacterized protein LOC131285904 [Anopheles ziemanni]
MDVSMMLFCILTSGMLWFQRVGSYVIVNKDSDVYPENPLSFGERELVENYQEQVPTPLQNLIVNSSQMKNLLELYYLVQVVRSYRRPAYQELAAIANGLFEQLMREDLRDELVNMLANVDGFEEIFNVGEYAEPDPLKEQLANDYRLLFPLVARTLNELRNPQTDGVDVLQGKLRQAMGNLRSMLNSLMHFESETFEEIEKENLIDKAIEMTEAMPVESNPAHLEETIYVTEIPAASVKDVVNDYDLVETKPSQKPMYGKMIKALSESGDDEEGTIAFLPNGNEVVYEVDPNSEESSHGLDDGMENNSPGVVLLTEDANMEKTNDPSMAVEAHIPKAVSVKDPEMVALVPVIVEQLRVGNVTPEEEQTLAEIFGELWPLMLAEADRLRAE